MAHGFIKNISRCNWISLVQSCLRTRCGYYELNLNLALWNLDGRPNRKNKIGSVGVVPGRMNKKSETTTKLKILIYRKSTNKH